jgi:hypothetical protein
MPWRPLAVTATLVGLDWGAWLWATSANNSTMGLIAGLVMAPIAVAFAWSLARVLVALAALALRWASPGSRAQTTSPWAGSPQARGSRVPFDIEAEGELRAQDKRIAA